MNAQRSAIEQGVNFIDTADVYGDGRSERLIARILSEFPGRVFVATKAGRRLSPHIPEGYNHQNLTTFVDRSLRNLAVDAIDLLQLHCPPTQVYYMPEVFEELDALVSAGKVLHYGVSVEKVEEAIKALEYPGVESVQIIFNIFRQRPAELFFEMPKAKQVAVLARVPLASGLLTGKMNSQTVFEKDDHRSYNRKGDAFDVGETFSGVPYGSGLQAVEKVRAIQPGGMSMPQLALRWILMFDAITLAIPGVKNHMQALENASAANLPPLSKEIMAHLKHIYDEDIRKEVYQRW